MIIIYYIIIKMNKFEKVKNYNKIKNLFISFVNC